MARQYHLLNKSDPVPAEVWKLIKDIKRELPPEQMTQAVADAGVTVKGWTMTVSSKFLTMAKLKYAYVSDLQT